MALLFWMNPNFEACFARLWDDLTGLLDACYGIKRRFGPCLQHVRLPPDSVAKVEMAFAMSSFTRSGRFLFPLSADADAGLVSFGL